MSASPIHFSRKPYTVVYKDFHSGELIHRKRRPPEKDHLMLPTDIVELKATKNNHWAQGDEVEIKHISYREPNVLQLKNEYDETTFLSSSEVDLVEEVAYREGSTHKSSPQDNRYLVWP